jgi:hypothetical protein
MINFGADVDWATQAEALNSGLSAVCVVCDEDPEVKGADKGSAWFIAFTPFLPRVGDRLELEDGTLCRVQRVGFRAAPSQTSPKITCLAPTVFTVRLTKEAAGRGL